MTPWHCSRCRRSGEVEDHVLVVFHRCIVEDRPRRRVSMPEVRGITREEARNAVWHGFAQALDSRNADWQLRPLESEVA